jgi:hypothetical protein
VNAPDARPPGAKASTDMILLYRSEAEDPVADRVERAVLVDFDVFLIRSIEEARTAMSRAWCFVLVDRRPTARTATVLTRVASAAPTLPRLLVTDRDGWRERSSVVYDPHCIVEVPAIDTDLRGEIRRVRAGGIRAFVRLVAGIHPQMTALARRSVMAATRAPRPFRTAAALARSLGCSRTTLWKAWRPVHRPPRGRLEDLLDWLLLVEGVARKRTTVAWTQIAQELGIHERTLLRIAVRLTGVGLRELAAEPELVLSDTDVRSKLIWLFGHETVNEVP